MIDKETIKKARQANIAEYLLNAGIPLIKQGNRYQHVEHDSLTFTENAYYWNSRHEHGNAIDYLVRHMGIDFTGAVQALTSGAARADEREGKSSANKKFADLAINSDNSRVIKYLNKDRHVGRGFINHLIESKLLFQEQRTNNAIFPMYDENNIIVGAELRGTTSKRFTGIKAGSKYGYGFNVRFPKDDKFDYALFFESSIDLLSFIDLKHNHEKKPLDGCLLVSMAGLKTNILQHTLKAFKGNLRVVLCVDNDMAGQAFKNEVQTLKIPFSVRAPDEKFKDWNEQLTAVKKSVPIARIMDNGSNEINSRFDELINRNITL